MDLKSPPAQVGVRGCLADSPKLFPPPPRAPGLLVVDDEGGVCGVLGLAMQQHGFAVWLAASGQEALDLYRCHRKVIDVVLLDVRMPGLDGPQTLAALQGLSPRVIRCCFMSGDLGSYTAKVLRNLGATNVFPKPFCLAEVAHVLWGLAAGPT